MRKFASAAFTFIFVLSVMGVTLPIAAETSGDSRLAIQAAVLIQDVRTETGRPLSFVELGLRLASGFKPVAQVADTPGELKQPGELFISANRDLEKKSK